MATKSKTQRPARFIEVIMEAALTRCPINRDEAQELANYIKDHRAKLQNLDEAFASHKQFTRTEIEILRDMMRRQQDGAKLMHKAARRPANKIACGTSEIVWEHACDLVEALREKCYPTNMEGGLKLPIIARPDGHILITGEMASGKTTLGKHIADTLKTFCIESCRVDLGESKWNITREEAAAQAALGKVIIFEAPPSVTGHMIHVRLGVRIAITHRISLSKVP